MNAPARIIIAGFVLGAIVVVLVVTGVADDKAKPGTRGRGVVTRTATSP